MKKPITVEAWEIIIPLCIAAKISPRDFLASYSNEREMLEWGREVQRLLSNMIMSEAIKKGDMHQYQKQKEDSESFDHLIGHVLERTKPNEPK